jgi:putative phosphoribosyl transferase
MGMRFRNREEAGQRLAEQLRRLAPEAPLVVGLPRGGIPVAGVVARLLGGSLRVLCVRKLASPWSPELAWGALAEGEVVVWEREVPWGLPDAPTAEALVKGQQAALARCVERFAPRRLGRADGRTVVVVDDGAATGCTMVAALRAARKANPARLLAGLPVASREAQQWIAGEADACVVVEVPAWFDAVSVYYEDFAAPDEASLAAWLEDREV